MLFYDYASSIFLIVYHDESIDFLHGRTVRTPVAGSNFASLAIMW